MCLITRDATIKIAEKDMYVYKQLEIIPSTLKRKGILGVLGFKKKHFYSLVNFYKYEKHVLQPYVQLRPYQYYSNPEKYEVNQGYHSDAGSVKGSNAVFVIPKGTKYIQGYYNNDKSRVNYVSETIIFKFKL